MRIWRRRCARLRLRMGLILQMFRHLVKSPGVRFNIKGREYEESSKWSSDDQVEI